MIWPSPQPKIYLASGVTDMRKGIDGLSTLVQEHWGHNPCSGALFLFRGRSGDRLKILWYSEQGYCLFAKRLEKGKFVWPSSQRGIVYLSPAQLSMLLEGIDWQRPIRTAQPLAKRPCLAG